MNSFRNRLVISLVVVLMLVQLVTAVFVLNAAHTEQAVQQKKSLDVGINVFREVLANRSQQLSQSLSVLSADFGFKRAIATGENETILSVLENHGSRISADAAVLLSPQGDLVFSSLPGIAESDINALFRLATDTSTSGAGQTFAFDNGSYQFVMQPVKAPTLIAWVGMGFMLDKQVAQQAKAITGVDISFVSRDDRGRYALQSTLGATAQAYMLPRMQLLSGLEILAGEGFPEHFLSFAVKLNEQSADQWAVLHLSNLKWEENFLHLRNTLLSIFAVTLGLSLIVTMWLSGSLVRPVNTLVQFARQIGQGEKPAPIHKAPVELQVLADTLTVMRDNIESREQDLIYQSSHDSLTGLFNRFAAKRHLAAEGKQLSGTLVLMDLKNFRHINDTIGFANADSLLV
ncbi:MAG: HAMP domain-containing protein, partial [Gammaproteobacteria bacterium]